MKSWRQSSKFINKGSLNHLTSIEENPEQHFAEIAHTIALAQENDIDTISIWKTGVMVCVIP
jgi:D-citramalate synthase